MVAEEAAAFLDLVPACHGDFGRLGVYRGFFVTTQ
jgi:hypothetical protein